MTIYEYIEYYKKNGYIKEMRKYVGHAPIMTCACGVIIENDDMEIGENNEAQEAKQGWMGISVLSVLSDEN